MEQISEQVLAACRSLVVSRLRLAELQHHLAENHSLVLDERRLYEERRQRLLDVLRSEKWQINKQALAQGIRQLGEPKTREDAIRALSLSILYQTLGNPSGKE